MASRSFSKRRAARVRQTGVIGCARAVVDADGADNFTQGGACTDRFEARREKSAAPQIHDVRQSFQHDFALGFVERRAMGSYLLRAALVKHVRITVGGRSSGFSFGLAY